MSQDPIVAGTDGSPRAELAVDKAGELAQALGAPVHVVCVPGAIASGPQEWPPRITAQQIVDDAGDRLRARGITVQAHIPKDRGDAAVALTTVAEAMHAQMIVVGNKGMTGVRRLLGSVPNHLSHEARCDVLIVPTDSQALAEFSGGAIVVGTDGSNRATEAVRTAIRLAQALGGALHIASAAKPQDSPDSALAAAQAQASDEGVEAATHELGGDPADGLLDLAERTQAAIIVVGSKGMLAGERERFGNVPEKVSHAAKCSVLIVFTGEASGSEGAALREVAAASGEAAG